MHTSPKQIVFEEAVAVLLRETQAVALGNGIERNHVIEHHKPTDPWITFRIFRRFSLDTNDFHNKVAVLFEMHVAPLARSHESPLRVLLTSLGLRSSMGLLALALKQGTIFGGRPLFAQTHGRSIEPAIALHANNDTD